MLNISQFALMNMVYNKYSFSYFLDSIEKIGAKKFELWTGVPHYYPLIETLAPARSIKKEVKARDLTIVCVTPEQVLYPFNIASEDRELRKQSLEYFKRNLELTAELEASKMLCCSGWVDFDGDVEEGFARAGESLKELADYAKGLGLVLAFEVLSSFESNIANSLASTKRLFDMVDSPAMELCVDTVAVTMAGDAVADYFETFGQHVCHFHLTDGSPAGHVPLGLGSLPIQDFLETLVRYNYRGDITLEIGDTQWATNPEEASMTAWNNINQYLLK